jgi:hypothetical protein
MTPDQKVFFSVSSSLDFLLLLLFCQNGFVSFLNLYFLSLFKTPTPPPATAIATAVTAAGAPSIDTTTGVAIRAATPAAGAATPPVAIAAIVSATVIANAAMHTAQATFPVAFILMTFLQGLLQFRYTPHLSSMIRQIPFLFSPLP